MSSTNRSDARSKHIADYYVTPQDAIRNFLDKFLKDENINLNYEEGEKKKYKILDPCAGGDEHNDMSYPAVLFEYGADYNYIITNDIRKDSLSKYKEDFINTDIFGENNFDIIITNPPFNVAQDVIKKSLEVCKPGGYVIMLLRLNYFGSKTRRDFWKNNMPISAYVHNKRMSFTEDKKTDSIEYMHCVWKKGENPENVKLSIIDDYT